MSLLADLVARLEDVLFPPTRRLRNVRAEQHRHEARAREQQREELRRAYAPVHIAVESHREALVAVDAGEDPVDALAHAFDWRASLHPDYQAMLISTNHGRDGRRLAEPAQITLGEHVARVALERSGGDLATIDLTIAARAMMRHLDDGAPRRHRREGGYVLVGGSR